MSELFRTLDDISADVARVILEVRKLGDDLAYALLSAPCACPSSGPCECERQQTIDAWVEATR